MIHDSEDKAEQSYSGLRLGARGWRHTHWNESFYPDDLPEDWQLGFYANEFSAVLVPGAYWLPGSGFDVDSWQDDVSTHFRFYIEWPEMHNEAEQQRCLEQCQRLGQLLGGIIVHQTIELATDLPVYYRHALCEPKRQLWTPDNHGESGLAWLSLAEQDMRLQKKYLQQFADSSENCECVLVSDLLPDIEVLRNFKTLIELLGL